MDSRFDLCVRWKYRSALLVAASSLQPGCAEVESCTGEEAEQCGESAETDPNRGECEAE